MARSDYAFVFLMMIVLAGIFMLIQKPTYEAEIEAIRNQKEILQRLDSIDKRYEESIQQEKRTQKLIQEDFDKNYMGK